MDSIDDLVDFDAFVDNGGDIRVTADRHLFDNGPDIFAIAHPHRPGESVTVPGFDNRVDPSAHATPRGYDMPQIADRNFFDDNLELFTDQYLDAGLTNFAPIDQFDSQSVVQQNDRNFGIPLEPAQPTMSQMPALAIQPAMMLSQTQASPQIVLATFEEQQQWQASKSQQTQFYQPQPQVPNFQQKEASYRWGNANEVVGLALQSPFESPIDELFQEYPDPEAPPNPRQTAEPSQQDLLSDEQIQLLQNAEPGAYIEPSVDFPPTVAAFPHSQLNAEPSPQSRSTQGHRSLSSRTPSPEPTSQAASTGLSFNNFDEAVEAMSSRDIENAWEAPSDDPTIPTTQDQRAKYVLDMLEAFQSCSKCKDNKNGNSYVKRWFAGPGSYYNLLAMEKVCWHMLDIAEHLHREGPQSTHIYCEEALKKLKTSRDMTFQQRIYHVCAMLKYSKYLCDQLMKGEGLEALVGAPKLKMTGATTMQVQNTRRQKWIVHGRTEDLHHSNADSNEVDEQDHVGEAQTPRRKTKTKQQTKQQTKRPATTKPRAKPKAGPANTSRDEIDDDEEAAYRRQSHPGIFQAGYSPDIEMDHEPKQIFAAVLQIPTPPPPSEARRDHQEPRDTLSIPPPAPESPNMAAPTLPVSSPEPTFQSSLSSTPSSTSSKSPKAMPRVGKADFDEQKAEDMRKKQDAMLAAYRAALKASTVSAEAKPVARKTQLAHSTTKKVQVDKAYTKTPTTNTSSKTKTKTGTRKSRIDLKEAEADSKYEKPTLKAKRKRTTTQLLSEHDKSTPKAKRQRTTKELLAEWMIRNDGSNGDDLREAGYASESGRLSDAEMSEGDEDHDYVGKEGENDNDKAEGESAGAEYSASNGVGVDEDKKTDAKEDTSEHPEESEPGTSDDQTPSPSPSPIRKRKMEKVAVKGDRIDQVHPLVKTSRYATKAEREPDKRKHKQALNTEPAKPSFKTTPAKSRKRKIPASEMLLISSDAEIETPPPKRTKRNDRSTRESTNSGLTKQISAPKDGKSKPLHNTNGRFLRRKAEPELSPGPDSKSELEPEHEHKKTRLLRDLSGIFDRLKRK